MMEKRMEMVEKSSFGTESLSEIIDCTEDEPDMARTGFDAKGNLVAMRVSSRVPLPENPEQLRRRIELWGNTWIMASLLHTNRSYLKDLTPHMFDVYIKYLLGQHVMGLLSTGPSGSAVSGDLWLKLLTYEHEVRKAAMKGVQKGKHPWTALKDAWEDTVVKMRFFTEPVLHGKKRAPDGDGEAGEWKRNRRGLKRKQEEKHDDKDKSKGKGNDKCKGKGVAGGCARETPEGQKGVLRLQQQGRELLEE